MQLGVLMLLLVVGHSCDMRRVSAITVNVCTG